MFLTPWFYTLPLLKSKIVLLEGTWLRCVSSQKVRQSKLAVGSHSSRGVEPVMGHSTEEAELSWGSRADCGCQSTSNLRYFWSLQNSYCLVFCLNYFCSLLNTTWLLLLWICSSCSYMHKTWDEVNKIPQILAGIRQGLRKAHPDWGDIGSWLLLGVWKSFLGSLVCCHAPWMASLMYTLWASLIVFCAKHSVGRRNMLGRGESEGPGSRKCVGPGRVGSRKWSMSMIKMHCVKFSWNEYKISQSSFSVN